MAAGDSTKLISPKELCHVVLKTTPETYSKLVDFYCTFLGAQVSHASDNITFLTYDDKDHRVAILSIPGLTRPDPPKSAIGMAHMSFGFDTLDDLVTSYEQKKGNGILPHWCINHGMTTSMYYTDPDGNEIETQVDNFNSEAECMAYIKGEQFAENPIGVEYDPDDFVRRVKSGEDHDAIKRRPNIGKRLNL